MILVHNVEITLLTYVETGNKGHSVARFCASPHNHNELLDQMNDALVTRIVSLINLFALSLSGGMS